MENLFKKAIILTSENKYKDLELLISKMEMLGCLHPELLVLKARCIQTSDQEISANLDDVNKSLEEAVNLDETYFPALVELGYFKLNILDNAESAINEFEKAIEIINRIAAEAIMGKAYCLAEIKSKNDALAYIEQVNTNVIAPEMLKSLLADIDFYASE